MARGWIIDVEAKPEQLAVMQRLSRVEVVSDNLENHVRTEIGDSSPAQMREMATDRSGELCA